MVVCRYFLEGQCAYGARCKFEHIDPYTGYDSPRHSDYSSEGRPQGTSILKAASSSFGRQEYTQSPQHGFVQPQPHGFSQNSFSRTPQNSFNQPPQHGFSTPNQQASFGQKPSGMKYSVQEIMHTVMRDIAQLEKGGQWQLSCYSPLKELPNIPGYEDYSPEELRWECYKALQNGSLPLCQVIVQQLYGNVAKVNNDLKRKETGYSIIDRYLRESESRGTQNTQEQPVPAFASPFGGTSNATGAFSSPFFANKPQTQQTQQPQPQTQSASAFSFSLSPQQPTPSANLFQQNTSVFSNNPTSTFTSSNQTSAFTPANQSSAFTTSSQTSAFASQNPSHSPFSSPLSGQVDDSQVYSNIEALTETQLKAFQADRFVLGSIPTKPPPKALCNL